MTRVGKKLKNDKITNGLTHQILDINPILNLVLKRLNWLKKYEKMETYDQIYFQKFAIEVILW